MSLWGATVITSLMSAIPWVGQDIVEFLWGGFSVNNATLNRFFALHFVLPFVLAALVLMHLIALHDSAGSGNPLGVSGNYDRLPFAPYYIFKDLITIFIFILVLSMFVFFMPNLLGDSENYVMANAMQTPPAIVPEWYLLPFYAILRSIPNKLLGVIAMFSAILILLVMPFTDLSRSRGTQFKPLSKAAFFIFVGNFLLLMELGAKHVESPFIEFGQISTVIYFAHFLIIVPLISLLENTLIEIASEKNVTYSKVYKWDAVTIIYSGWWWDSYDKKSRQKLFESQKPYKGRLHGPNKLNLEELLEKSEKRIDQPYKDHKIAWDRVNKIWWLDKKKVSEYGPTDIKGIKGHGGNRAPRPFNWITFEEHLKNKRLTYEQFLKHNGGDTETIKEFQEAWKDHIIAEHNKTSKDKVSQILNEKNEWEDVKKRNERRKKNNDNNKKGGGGAGGVGFTTPEHAPSSSTNSNQNNRIINLESFILIFKYSISTLLGVLLFSIFSHFSVNTGFLTASPSYCDAPRPWHIYYQDSASPQMDGLVELHDRFLFYLVIILFGLALLLISIVINYSNTESPISHKYLSHGTLIERTTKKGVTYYMEQPTHVSGWWWEDLHPWTLEALFKKPYTGVCKNWNPERGEISLTPRSELDWYHSHKRFWPNQGVVGYHRGIKAWIREDNLVSPDAPLPFNERGTLKPFRWMSIDKYFQEKGWNLQKYIKDNGLDNETVKAYEEALKAHKEQKRAEAKKRAEEAKKKKDDDDNDGNGPYGGVRVPFHEKDQLTKPYKPLYDPNERTIANFSWFILITLAVSLLIAGLTVLVLSLPLFEHTGFSTSLPSYCDAPRPWGIYFQDSATPQMEGLVELHDNILFYLVIILFGVGWLLISIVKSYSNTESPITHKYLSHGTLVELIWTITPALILILIAFPSFKLLYLMDEVSDPAMAVLAEGHQWYWSYQYPDFLNSDDEFIEFDSYLVPESDLEDGALRMLEVDNRLIIPELTHIRFIVTAADVIHALSCPALGIKCDAYPGRLNQTSVMVNREGTFYGQCSEICGILHSSMPIVIESVSIDKFVSWLQAQ